MRVSRYYDVIGDIHGQGRKLHFLLRKLDYRFVNGAYRHPESRTAIFVGDLIDRGPEQVDVVKTVRSMVDAGSALCVMGNHEFHAIGFATPSRRFLGEFLHPRTRKNTHQHGEYLRQVGEGSSLHREHIAWFRQLPVALDLGEIRVVHAWWHQPYVDLVAKLNPPGGSMTDAFLERAFTDGSPDCSAIKGLTRGLELVLPDGASFLNEDGTSRRKLRVKWWERQARSYREAFIPPAGIWEGADAIEQPVPDHLWLGRADEQRVPTFIGHYWLTGHPAALTPKVACLDYSVANQGPLVGYRWSGESDLLDSHFISV